MEGRIRILFLRIVLLTLLLSGLSLTNVYAADENSNLENNNVGLVVDGGTTTGPESSQTGEQKVEPLENDQIKPKRIKAVPIEGDSTQVIQPIIHRREIDIDKVDTEDFEIGAYVGLLSTEDFGANMVVGARAAYHITEQFFTEAAYGMSDTTETSYERLSGGAQLLTPEDRKLTYYNISLGYNILPGEAFYGDGLAFNSTLYIVAGAGITRFAGDNLFTVNYGAGYRLLTSDWLALHIDFRDHIFELDLLGVKKTTHNLEMHGGFTIFF